MHNRTLSKYYFINKFDQNHIDKLDKETIIIYRNYNKNTNKQLILNLKKHCKTKGNKFLLSNNIKLAINLDLDGAYIPSFNYDLSHLSFSFKKEFILLGSAHNIYEMRIKELQNVREIFLSSIFKKNKNYLGSYRFKLLSNLTKKKIIALGGISEKNLKKLNFLNLSGFAAISFFE